MGKGYKPWDFIYVSKYCLSLTQFTQKGILETKTVSLAILGARPARPQPF